MKLGPTTIALAVALTIVPSPGPAKAQPTHPLDQMVVAFEGSFTRAQIKARLDKAMRLYGLPITRENYSRAGSVLVTMRKDLGPWEMDILRVMIEMHVPGFNLSFPDAAAIAATCLSGDRVYMGRRGLPPP